jgi:hypothetical protein
MGFVRVGRDYLNSTFVIRARAGDDGEPPATIRVVTFPGDVLELDGEHAGRIFRWLGRLSDEESEAEAESGSPPGSTPSSPILSGAVNLGGSASSRHAQPRASPDG